MAVVSNGKLKRYSYKASVHLDVHVSMNMCYAPTMMEKTEGPELRPVYKIMKKCGVIVVRLK